MLEDLSIPQKKQTPCKVRTIAETLNSVDKKIFVDACNSEEWSAVILSRELRKRDIEISDRTIRTHRAGACSC